MVDKFSLILGITVCLADVDTQVIHATSPELG